ncbi:MAG: chemotaxis response regulator protein-glutamate methylesterase [Desulfuromonadaceae bacterium]|nr:chemotaxis response regulator protein-glutamate methylesterase [Desulfuromonadaceae bacterium]
MSRKIRVLIIDDSALVRNILAQGLASDPGIEVVGTATDPYHARDLIIATEPDVLTLDVEMPRMDGVEFLRRLMPQHPLPVVMVSALTQHGKQITIEALDAGAVDFVSKPSVNVASGLHGMIVELCTKIKIASTANVSHWKMQRGELVRRLAAAPATRALAESTDKVIVIGASTGGTEAIRRVITHFPAGMPGVVIVQHMPPGFTTMFAQRLNQLSAMQVHEAADGDRIMPGVALVAPGGVQMQIVRSGGIYRVACAGEERVNGHCPSVNVLMHSAAKHVGANAIGVLLTGMGADGALGLKAMRDAGARTLGQDERTCVVFGMPKMAHELGATETLLSIDEIAPAIIERLRRKTAQTGGN